MNRNATTTRLLLRSYARNQGSQATISTIVADMMTNDENEISVKTAGSYLEALRKIFVIEDSEAWNPNLRSKTSIRTANTRYFIDPSIGTAVLGLGPKDLINDLNTMGLFLKPFVFEIYESLLTLWMEKCIIIVIKTGWNVMPWCICAMENMDLLK